jgi:flagellar assembly protein FliH
MIETNRDQPSRIASEQIIKISPHSDAKLYVYKNVYDEIKPGNEKEDSRHYAEGYETGYQEGISKAKSEYEEQFLVSKNRVDSVLETLANAVLNVKETERELLKRIEKTVPEVAYEIVEAILTREIQTLDDPGREAITRALTIDTANESATIHLNPQDIKTLTDLSDLKTKREIEIVVDPDIESGDALVVIGKATIDARISSALERVKKILKVHQK